MVENDWYCEKILSGGYSIRVKGVSHKKGPAIGQDLNIATVSNTRSLNGKGSFNARLITKAPILLKELKNIREGVNITTGHFNRLQLLIESIEND